jgi:hypothetical protein
VVDSLTFQPFVSFGTVAVGQTASGAVVIISGDTLLCKVGNIDINPNDQWNEFGVQAGAISPGLIDPGQSLDLTVTFSPMTGTPPLARTAALSITTYQAILSTVTLPLSGTVQ